MENFPNHEARRGLLRGLQVLTTQPNLHPYLPLLVCACEISSQLRAGVCDCLYIALAEREGCDFVTADDRLVRNLRPQFSIVVPLSSLP